MSDFAVFECTAVLPKENVSKFKTLFYHEGKDRREKNFGVAANWSEEDIADNLTRVMFDCQNGQGIYFGWYKTEVDGMNMEGHCRKLQAHGLVAINEWQSPKTADEYWLYLHGEIMIMSQCDPHSSMQFDVHNGVDYVAKQIKQNRAMEM